MCSWSMFFSPFVFRTRNKRTGGTSDFCHPRISVVLGRDPERKILWIDRGARPVIVSVEAEDGKEKTGRYRTAPRRRGRYEAAVCAFAWMACPMLMSYARLASGTANGVAIVMPVTNI